MHVCMLAVMAVAPNARAEGGVFFNLNFVYVQYMYMYVYCTTYLPYLL